MRRVRIAICQLESHPALFASHLNYLTEPFVPAPGGASLSLLSTKGLDVGRLEVLCREQYLTWNQTRLGSVLQFLGAISPQVDIVLFPEGSVPVEVLGSLAQWSGATAATILAGSHSPRRSSGSVRRYRELGVADVTLNRVFKYGSTNTLPLIRSGEVTLIPKQLLSPFEHSIVMRLGPALPAVRPYVLRTHELKLLPLICADALQLHAIAEPYDIVGIISYDSKPEQFRPYIDQQIANRKVVGYCNDGAFGGSGVHVVVDRRSPNWLVDALPRGLPPGDSILVVDVDLDVSAVEVGTAAPQQSLELISLASIVAERSLAGGIAMQVMSISELAEPTARAQELRAVLRRPGLDDLQRIRIEHLQRLDTEGQPSDLWWDRVSKDCVIPAQSSLRELEARLAATCSEELTTRILTSRSVKEADTALALVAYLAECGKRSMALGAGPLAVVPESQTEIVDRDSEIREFHRFLDDRALGVLELSGLEQIGKSAVLAKALAQSGLKSVLRIPFTDTSSADYIVQAILGRGAGTPTPPYADPVGVMRGQGVATILEGLRVVVLERADLLLTRQEWRDELIRQVLEALVAAAALAKCKMVFETRRQLPLVMVDPAARKPLRVSGLSQARSSFGMSLFDAQLRRVGLAPDLVGANDKTYIVNRLGGHPVAIALAADVAYEEGPRGLIESLRAHQGRFLNFVSRLVRSLELSEEEQRLLRMLCLARTGVPREALLKAADFAAGENLRELIALGAVEVGEDGLVEIAGVLREFFNPQQLSAERRQAFHRAAAESYTSLAERRPRDLAAAVEAEFHAGMVGATIPGLVSTQLIDGALASAIELCRSGEYDRAGAIVASLLERRRTLDLIRLAARVEANRNNFDGALAYAKEAFRRDPRDSELLADLSKIALTQYREDVAEQLITVARGAGVEDVAILIVEGRMKVRRRDLQGAERAFGKARDLTVRNVWPFFYLGVTYMRSGRLDEAISTLQEGESFYYERNLRSRGALMALRTKLVVACLFAGRYDLAEPILKRLIEEDPDNPEVLRAQGALVIAKEGIQQTAKALELLHRPGVKDRRDRCQLGLFRGMFYLGISDHHRAAEEFRRALEADSINVFVMMKLARTLYELALASWRSGEEAYKAQLDECIGMVRRILRIDRDNYEGVALVQDISREFGVSV